MQRIVDRHILVQNRVRVVDLSAACASKIAPEQRFQHQYEWIALAASEMLADNVATNEQLL
jgi:hypothetical protein